MYGIHLVGILEDVCGHCEGYALYPSVVIEVVEEGRERVLVVEDLQFPGIVGYAEQSCMRTDGVDHRIEVVPPHVDGLTVLRVQSNTDTCDICLGCDESLVLQSRVDA